LWEMSMLVVNSFGNGQSGSPDHRGDRHSRIVLMENAGRGAAAFFKEVSPIYWNGASPFWPAAGIMQGTASFWLAFTGYRMRMSG